LSFDEISKWVDDMEREANLIRKEGLKMSWYMRGGMTYEDVMNLSFGERELVGDLIKDNLETTKKSKMPFF